LMELSMNHHHPASFSSILLQVCGRLVSVPSLPEHQRPFRGQGGRPTRRVGRGETTAIGLPKRSPRTETGSRLVLLRLRPKLYCLKVMFVDSRSETMARRSLHLVVARARPRDGPWEESPWARACRPILRTSCHTAATRKGHTLVCDLIHCHLLTCHSHIYRRFAFSPGGSRHEGLWCCPDTRPLLRYGKTGMNGTKTCVRRSYCVLYRAVCAPTP
jgi:hypothetical protein